MKPILIILQTYQRTAYALRTIRAAKANLKSSHEFKWYIADDGSEVPHVRRLMEEIGPELVAGYHSERISYGAGGNRAIEFAKGLTGLTLWLEDDWELRDPLDLTPYAELLEEHVSVGMIRLGWLPGGLDTEMKTYNEKEYLSILPTTPYMFSGNPRLAHRRFHECYGPFPENEKPGETERIFDSHMRFHVQNGVKVLWDPGLGRLSVWNHIGDVKSF